MSESMRPHDERDWGGARGGARRRPLGSDERESLGPWWRVIVGWSLVAAGAIAILLGWVGVATNPSVARQMSYLVSGGIGGLALVIVGVGLLVSDDLRAERRRLGRIEATLLDVQEALSDRAEPEDGVAPSKQEGRRRRRT